MRNQWRFLLRHRHHHFLSAANISRPLSLHQVNTTTPRKSSLSFSSSLPYDFHPPFHRYFSSEVEKSPESSLVVEIFSKPHNNDEIKKEIESNNVVISHDRVLDVLGSLESNPSSAIKFFDWVLERESERLSSKSYNLMLGILGINGLVKEFWDMVANMKCKGYGVSKGTFIKVSEKFEKDGSQADLEKLKGLFSNDLNSSVEMACSRITKIVRNKVWDDGVENELRELGVTYSSDLVKMVLEKMSMEPMKGLIFFRWVEESGVLKHDKQTYNAMALLLGRQDCCDRFWNIVDEMRNAGHEMEMGSYVKILDRFIKRRMLKDAVNLYVFAMNGANKPSLQDCTFLLRKIAVAKKLDMELFSEVVKTFTENGFVLEDSMFDGVLKSLTSVGRMSYCNKIMEVMAECGFRPNKAMQNRVAFDLSSSRMKDESNEFMQKLEVYGETPDYRTWASLIEGHSVAGDLDKAKDCFQKMVEKEGSSSIGYALDMLVNAYCNRDRATEACKFLSDVVNKEGLKPWHTTYKTLISKLLVQRGFQDALTLLGLMKNNGFPPFLDPFVAYLSRRGTADEAVMFFKAMTVKKFPSTNVFVRVFEAFFKAGRHKEAQNLLAKCPQYIRNHAEVLNMFCSMKYEKPVKPAAVAA